MSFDVGLAAGEIPAKDDCYGRVRHALLLGLRSAMDASGAFAGFLKMSKLRVKS